MPFHSCLHIGITGGIGSGKSTITSIWAEKTNAAIIDADKIARACTQAHGSAIAPIHRIFGSAFINTEGALDRKAMRDLILRSPQAKQTLEAIIHPIVLQQAQQLAQKALEENKRTILYDIPLLTESTHWRKRLHYVVVVDCEEETQIKRIVQRDHLAHDVARSILKQQASRLERRQIADAIVDNDSEMTLMQLHKQINTLIQHFAFIMASLETRNDFCDSL